MRLTRSPILMAAVLAAGCGGRPDPAPTPPDAAVELKDVTYAELDRAIAARKGKVVLVDVWATW
jgi:thiol:disulfide interchange protein